MTTQKRGWARAARALGASSFIILLTVVAAWRLWSQSTPPFLSIALTSPNEVTLTVTNGSPTGIYEIWWTEFLDEDLSLTNGAWLDLWSGTTGETNFVVDLGDTYTGFFQALNGNDLDNDGIVNWQDARPFDAAVGLLQVTIESPANGSNVR